MCISGYIKTIGKALKVATHLRIITEDITEWLGYNTDKVNNSFLSNFNISDKVGSICLINHSGILTALVHSAKSIKKNSYKDTMPQKLHKELLLAI